MNGLVLSLFPGIGLLDMAFEAEGFCVVRGPDLLWGGDIRSFHPPAGKFDGVIGGPPCQLFSQMRHINPHVGVHGNLIPEFERICGMACPAWFVMENVKDAPAPVVEGYYVHQEFLNCRWLGEEQNRLRRFSFGTPDGLRLRIETVALESPSYERAVTSAHEPVPVKIGGNGKVKKSWKPPTVTGGHGAPMSHERGNDAPFTSHGKRKVIGNGVPLPMGRAVAKAVKRAIGAEHMQAAE